MAKNIVICCDGTGHQYGTVNTNVVRIFEMLTYGDHQKIFYDPGVGTASKLLLLPLQKVATVLSQALGLDLQKNVEEAYFYLMNNYEEGDRVFLFGYSRGAHTVRRLATMLENLELLQKGSENMIPYVSRMYLRREKLGEAVLSGFRKAFCRPCPVHFIGVWDTISSVSRLLPRPKLDGVFSSEVKYAYHAVAIDEARFNFPPNLWKKDTIAEGQIVEELWFAGSHADVGGGREGATLSSLSLLWIAEKASAAGLSLRKSALQDLVLDPLGPIHASWRGVWWFIPFPLYAGLLIVSAFFFHGLFMAVNSVWGFEITFFQTLVDFIEKHWVWMVLGMIALIPFTRKQRVVPQGACIHQSVKVRIDKLEYRHKLAPYRVDN